MVLDTSTAFVGYTSVRDQRAPETKEVLQTTVRSAEENLKQLAYKYRKETYLTSEYIEILHARYDAQKALDSYYANHSEAKIKSLFIGLPSQHAFRVG